MMAIQQLWKPIIKLGLIYLLFSPLFTAPCSAQTYTQGYASYTRGDFQGAIEIFRNTLARKRPTSTEERAQLFKYMGISHYMLGERREAARSFRSAIGLNPELTIEPKEVLDESVIGFFAEVVRRVKRSKDPPSQASADSATVTVNSNVDGAEVLIDGKVIGRVNEPFQARPGVSEVEIRAPGHGTRQVRLTIRPKQTHRFDIVLRRESPDSSSARSQASQRGGEGRPRRVVLPGEHEIPEVVQVEPPSRRQPTPEVEIPVPSQESSASKGQTSPQGLEDPSRSQVSSFSAVHLLPFGTGQFRNGQNLAGSLFAVSEVALLGLYFQSTRDEKTTRDTASGFIERESIEGNISTEALEAYRVEANKAILDEQKQQQLYLTGFGILWLTGVIHAILTSKPETLASLSDEDAPYAFSHISSDPRSPRLDLTPSHGGGLALELNLRF